jgi:hypothetical protein
MKKYRLGIVISFLVLVLGYFVNRAFNPFYKKIQWLENEIPKHNPVDVHDSLDGVVTKVFETRGWTYVTFRNATKISIPTSRNGLYEENFIGDFLKVGDQLYKRPKSDTLEVMRGNEKYYFLIGKIINE